MKLIFAAIIYVTLGLANNQGYVLGAPFDANKASNNANQNYEILSLYASLHSCIVFTNSKLKCFGYNLESQLGYGDNRIRGDDPNEMGNNLLFVDLGADCAVTHVSGGVTHTCVLCSNSKVKCFGDGRYGQLGNGAKTSLGGSPNAMGDALPYVDLGENLGTKQIEVGSWHTCVLLSNLKLKCFGFGFDVAAVEELEYIDFGTDATIKEIAAGAYHICALFTNAKVSCFGMNHVGQLGYGNTALNNSGLVDFGTDLAVTQVAGGFQHTCVVFDASKLKCFGNNTFGQLGYGDKLERGGDPKNSGQNLGFVNLGEVEGISKVSLGYAHTCVLFTDFKIKCFGYNRYGQLGYGDRKNRGDDKREMGDKLRFVELGTKMEVAELYVGLFHTCVVLSDRTLKCFGSNEAGQLGYGTKTNIGDEKKEMGDNLDFVDLGSPANGFKFSAAIGGFRDPSLGPIGCDVNWKYRGRPGTGRIEPRTQGDNNCLSIEQFKPFKSKKPRFDAVSAEIQAAVPEGYAIDPSRWCSFTKAKCSGHGVYFDSRLSRRIGECTVNDALEAWGFCMYKISDSKRFGAGAFQDPKTTGVVQCDENWSYSSSVNSKKRVLPDADNCLDIREYPPFKPAEVLYPPEAINSTQLSSSLILNGGRWCSTGVHMCNRRGNKYSPTSQSATAKCTKGQLRRAWVYCLYQQGEAKPTIPKAIGAFRDPSAGPIECDHGQGVGYKLNANSGPTIEADTNSTFSIDEPTRPFFRNGGTSLDYDYDTILPEHIPEGYYVSRTRWCSFKAEKCSTKSKIYFATPKASTAKCSKGSQRRAWGYALLPL